MTFNDSFRNDRNAELMLRVTSKYLPELIRVVTLSITT